MARNVYDKKTRAAFMAAALGARKAGKTWPEAFEAATKAGYKGSLQGISKLGRVEEAPASPGRKRGPGRPPKAKTVSASTHTGGGIESIQKTIDGLVKARVRVALQKAIETLQEAAG